MAAASQQFVEDAQAWLCTGVAPHACTAHLKRKAAAREFRRLHCWRLRRLMRTAPLENLGHEICMRHIGAAAAAGRGSLPAWQGSPLSG